jgi:hypothetical protein
LNKKILKHKFYQPSAPRLDWFRSGAIETLDEHNRIGLGEPQNAGFSGHDGGTAFEGLSARYIWPVCC